MISNIIDFVSNVIEFIAKNYLATIISIIVAYIAYRQWRTEEEKKRLELFEKRFEFYQLFMLNPLWETLFYKKEEVSKCKKILEEQKKHHQQIIDRAYFLFDKRTYDKVCLTYHKLCYLCGYQHAINHVKELDDETVKIDTNALADRLEKDLIEKDINDLKKEYKSLLEYLHSSIAIERQMTIWDLMLRVLLIVWDFFIPYRSKKLKHEENMQKMFSKPKEKIFGLKNGKFFFGEHGIRFWKKQNSNKN